MPVRLRRFLIPFGLSMLFLSMVFFVQAQEPLDVSIPSLPLYVSEKNEKLPIGKVHGKTVTTVPRDFYTSVSHYPSPQREDLLAIALTESNFRQYAVGDNGHSLGAFQHNRRAHPEVTEKCAYDLSCAATLAALRLKQKGYDARSPYKRRIAFQRYNGSGDAAVRYGWTVYYVSEMYRNSINF